MFNQYLPFQGAENNPQLSALFVVLLVWSVTWKLIALWKAARKDQKVWFAAIFLVNAVGLLELVYLGFFQKGEKNIIDKLKEKRSSKKKK